MGYKPSDFEDPYHLFELRTREVRTRIQRLEVDLLSVRHPVFKAIVLNELNNAVDDYIERKSLFTRALSTEREPDE